MQNISRILYTIPCQPNKIYMDMGKIEKARIRQQITDYITKNNRDLTILISTEDHSFRLSPEAKTVTKKDKAGNLATNFLSEVLHHGFTNKCLDTQTQETCYNWVCELFQNHLGFEINIIHEDNASYIQFSFNCHIPDTGTFENSYLSIVATDELLGIIRNGKVPVMETKGDISKLPTIWQKMKDTTGIRTEVIINSVTFTHEDETKEFRSPIILRGNQLRYGFFERLTVVADEMFKTGNILINLKDAHIEYFFDEYDNVFRGEIVKVCNISEWRALRIEDLNISDSLSLSHDVLC